MLQSMRQSTQSTAAKVIIGLIVLSFAAFGLETLLPGGSGTSVAEVNGEEITPFALQEAITQQKRQLVSVLGDDIDPAMLDDDRLQPRALQSLIQRALLLQKSTALNLVASEAQVGKSITSIEAFQFNGKFSPDAYKSVLAGAGYTPERFRRAQAEDIVLTQITDRDQRDRICHTGRAGGNGQSHCRGARCPLPRDSRIRAGVRRGPL